MIIVPFKKQMGTDFKTCYLCKCVRARWHPALGDLKDCSPSGSSAPGVLQCWSGLPFPPAGDLPDPGVKPMSPAPPALQAGSLP